MAPDIFNNTAYAGRKPAWHFFGNVVPDADTMSELAVAAGLTFRYETQPLFYERETLDDVYHVLVPNRRVLLRIGGPDGGAVGEVVSNDFEYQQPMEVAESLDTLLNASHGWTPETALALGNGFETAFCIHLGDWSVGGSDRCRDFLLVTDHVDGRHALTAAVTTERVVCRNTLRLALRKASVKLRLTHVRGHRDEYSRMIQDIQAKQNRVREALTELSRMRYRRERLAELHEAVFEVPEETQYPATVRRMGELRETAMGCARRMIDEGVPLSGWLAWNSVSEAIEHGGIMPDMSTRKSLLTGTGRAAEMLERAYALVPRFAER